MSNEYVWAPCYEFFGFALCPVNLGFRPSDRQIKITTVDPTEVLELMFQSRNPLWSTLSVSATPMISPTHRDLLPLTVCRVEAAATNANVMNSCRLINGRLKPTKPTIDGSLVHHGKIGGQLSGTGHHRSCGGWLLIFERPEFSVRSPVERTSLHGKRTMHYAASIR